MKFGANDMWDEITVKSIVLDLYDLSQVTSITDEDGNQITIEDLQHLFYQDIENLADLLGIDLDERSN